MNKTIIALEVLQSNHPGYESCGWWVKASLSDGTFQATRNGYTEGEAHKAAKFIAKKFGFKGKVNYSKRIK